MIGLIQRVCEASVAVDGTVIARIGTGLLVLAAVERGDTESQAQRLAHKLCAYRVFPDDAGRMNLSVTDVGGGLLLVPQFTLAANTRTGNRASFSDAADPGTGRALFDRLVDLVGARCGGAVETGQFGAAMQVALVNDGPVTFWLQIPPGR